MVASLDCPSRRLLIGAGAVLAAGVGLSGCGKASGPPAILATEALAWGHGLLRRITTLFREAAPNVRINPGALDFQALAQAARLFRAFGEDYQEKALEEERVFPAVQKAGGDPAALLSTLVLQHQRGREIIDYIAAKCAGGVIGAADAEPLARTMESLARMYDEHTAVEETVIFPAWRRTMSEKQLHDASEEFAKLEQARFKGGFDQALAEVKQLEQRAGLVHLHLFTAPPPSSDAPAPVKEQPRR